MDPSGDPGSSSTGNKLESSELKTTGLIKIYSKPFSKYTKENLKAHEALGVKDYIMRKYNDDGSLYWVILL